MDDLWCLLDRPLLLTCGEDEENEDDVEDEDDEERDEVMEMMMKEAVE